MLLTSQIYKVTAKYKGSTKYDFWKDLEIGHTFEVSTILKYTHNHRGNNYAIVLEIKNLTNGQKFKTTMNNFLNYLSKIEYTIN